MRLFMLISAFLLLSTMAFSAEWPQFRGIQADGCSPEQGINKAWNEKAPAVLWQIPLGDNGHAGPAVAGGKVFIIDHQGDQDVVRAIDIATGKDVWTFPYADPFKFWNGFARTTPAVDGDRLYTLSASGQLYCLDTAAARWQNTNMQASFNAPILADGYLYGNSDPGNLVCLELATGNLAWSQGGFDKGGLLAVDGTLIALQGATGDIKLVKLQATAYEELGALKPLGGQGWAPPVLADGKLIVRTTKALACIDLK